MSGDTFGEIWYNSCNFHDHDKEKEEDIVEFDVVDDSAILIMIRVAI